MASGIGAPGSSGMSMWDLVENGKDWECYAIGPILWARGSGHLPTEHRRVPYRKVVALVQQGIADRAGEAPYVEN